MAYSPSPSPPPLNGGWGAPIYHPAPPGGRIQGPQLPMSAGDWYMVPPPMRMPTSEERSAEEEEVYKQSIVQQDRKLLRHQIWSQEEARWKPFDPNSYESPKIPPKDPNNYFYINMRRTKSSVEPDVVLSDFSEALVYYLRVAYGDQFYSPSPEKSAPSFFRDVHSKTFRKALERTQEVLSESDPDKRRERSIDLGYLEAKKKETEDEEITKFLEALVEQLPVLIEYLEEQFEPIRKELELSTSYGHIAFHLLQYLFNTGEELTTLDSAGKPIVFIMQSTEYSSSWSSQYLNVSGYGYEWNGEVYTQYPVTTRIYAFEGTNEIAGLSCRHTNPILIAELIQRGKLYASYAGVHYKTVKGVRVIIDGRGYRDQDGYIREPNEVIPEIDPEHLHLLPAFHYGFNLKKKVWEEYLIEQLQDVVFDEHAWNHLVLDDDIKTLIRALVKVTRNSNSANTLVQDVISGKGGGLIAILHGPPGTGKTLTAEAVAEHLKRPLYMVGSAELSTTSAELEANLKKILSLATAWDAVLLIDEADVFLEQRSLHELERNALVSVALRLLEYHRGVLFLTTNRITAFDDAFLSRFSIAVKYPELDKAARLTVWKRFLTLAGCKVDEAGGFASKDLDDLAEKPFNGRTVKNLVRTGQALALSMEEPLAVHHLSVVVRAQEKFLQEFAS